MAQMGNRDPDSILFNWRLSRLNGHSCAHTHRGLNHPAMMTTMVVVVVGLCVCRWGTAVIQWCESGLRQLFALPPLDLFRQEPFSLRVYKDHVKNAVLSHLWNSHQAWSESLPSGLAVCGPNAFPVYTYTFKYGDQQLLFVLFFFFFIYGAFLYLKSSFN